MPTLNWIGKEAVVKHHKDVPFRLLEPVAELSCGDSTSGNLIVQGDNLHALKALLPRYAGQVKCIYIDPPYNTGFECACWLDIKAQQGHIRYWVRNLVRKAGCSFFLQKATDRFYPDFLCLLPNNVILAVEYKGANHWNNAEDDRLIGGLWAALSNGKCRFIMTKDKHWDWIEPELHVTQ